MNVLNAQARDVGRLNIIADMPDMTGAACHGTPEHIWFSDTVYNPHDEPHYREPKPVRTQRIKNMAAAIEICQGCALLTVCREYSETHPAMTEFGIWAGRTARERRARRNAQRRQTAADGGGRVIRQASGISELGPVCGHGWLPPHVCGCLSGCPDCEEATDGEE